MERVKNYCQMCGSTENLSVYMADKWFGSGFTLCDNCRKELENDICHRIAYRYREDARGADKSKGSKHDYDNRRN